MVIVHIYVALPEGNELDGFGGTPIFGNPYVFILNLKNLGSVRFPPVFASMASFMSSHRQSPFMLWPLLDGPQATN
jgi:hypothetical protein